MATLVGFQLRPEAALGYPSDHHVARANAKPIGVEVSRGGDAWQGHHANHSRICCNFTPLHTTHTCTLRKSAPHCYFVVLHMLHGRGKHISNWIPRWKNACMITVFSVAAEAVDQAMRNIRDSVKTYDNMIVVFVDWKVHFMLGFYGVSFLLGFIIIYPFRTVILCSSTYSTVVRGFQGRAMSPSHPHQLSCSVNSNFWVQTAKPFLQKPVWQPATVLGSCLLVGLGEKKSTW